MRFATYAKPTPNSSSPKASWPARPLVREAPPAQQRTRLAVQQEARAPSAAEVEPRPCAARRRFAERPRHGVRGQQPRFAADAGGDRRVQPCQAARRGGAAGTGQLRAQQRRVVPAVRLVQPREGQGAVHRHRTHRQRAGVRWPGAPLGLDEPCQSGQFAAGQRDPGPQAQRVADLASEVRAGREPRDPAYDLTDHEPEEWPWYSCAVPGSHSSFCSSTARITGVQAAISSKPSTRSSTGRPAR
jgi:hypothetical protein